MFITVRGKKIHYEEGGNGEPLLFVHGWGGSMKSLHRLYELSSRRFHSVILDLPGFGESENPDADWGVGEYASHITTFMNTLNLRNVTYFGHSFGGAVGVSIAHTSPEMLKRLILCDASFKRIPKISSSANKFRSIAGRLGAPPAVTAKLRSVYYKLFYPDSDITKAPHLESNFRKIVTEDLTPYIREVSIKTLIIWGENDRITPVAWAHELHSAIAESEIDIVSGAGHGVPLRNPERVFESIETFVSKH